MTKWPTCPAGPHFPEAPIKRSLLRVIPGSPRDDLPPVDWILPSVAPVALKATQGKVSAHIPIPTGSVVPSHWFDFDLHHTSSPYVSISIVSDTTLSKASEGVPFGTAVILLDDVCTDGVHTFPVVSLSGIPVARLRITVLRVSRHDGAVQFAKQRQKQHYVPRFTGHRGMGPSHPETPWRPLENSPSSFLRAVLPNPDINAIELDVQPTADNQPVIYHDWFFRPLDSHASPVFGNDLRIPIHSITLDQFDRLFRMSHPHASAPNPQICDSNCSEDSLRYASQKMGIPISAWESKVRTLSEILDLLPASIGMLIELKYPSLDVQQSLQLPYPSKDAFVNTVLDTVLSSKGIRSREIAFLCFEPSVCELLVLKQQSFPVYFSHCETLSKPCDEEDPRCTSLGEGLSFVSTRNLDGIMMLNSLVELRPEVVKTMTKLGFPILTYGTRNSDPEFVQKQFDAGIGGVIADDVHRLWRGLQVISDRVSNMQN